MHNIGTVMNRQSELKMHLQDIFLLDPAPVWFAGLEGMEVWEAYDVRPHSGGWGSTGTGDQL